MKKPTIKELLYKTNPYIKYVCKNPIFIFLFFITTLLLCCLGKYFNNHKLLMFIISICFPPIMVWIIKSRKNSGKPWGGGIISGHAAYTSTVYFLTIYSLVKTPIIFLTSLIPVLFIIISRCSEINSKAAIRMLILSFISQMITITLLCFYGKSWIIVLANTILLLLIIEAHSTTNVHKRKEVLYGTILGIVSTGLFISAFQAWW